MVERLKLTDDQRKAMDGIMLEHREKLIDLQANLEKAELAMQPLMSADTPNDAAITAQIDKVVQARGDLERANARFLLAIRDKLTPDQWKQVQTFREDGGMRRAGLETGRPRAGGAGAWQAGTGCAVPPQAAASPPRSDGTPAPGGECGYGSRAVDSEVRPRGLAGKRRHRGRGLIRRAFGREQIRLHQNRWRQRVILLPPFFCAFARPGAAVRSDDWRETRQTGGAYTGQRLTQL